MTSPLVAREAPPSRPFIFVPPIDEKYQWKEPSYDYEDWGDMMGRGGNWPDIFFKKPNKSPTIGPYPGIENNDDFKQKLEWIAGLDIDEDTKKQLLGTLAHQVLLPKGKVTTPEEFDKFLEVASRYGKDAANMQTENLLKLGRQKSIRELGNVAIKGARAVAVAGLPHKDYVSGHGLTAGLGKPSNIMRTYFG